MKTCFYSLLIIWRGGVKDKKMLYRLELLESISIDGKNTILKDALANSTQNKLQ